MLPDPERIAVKWAKANTAIAAVVGDSVATRLPRDWPSPFLRCFLVGGTIRVAEDSNIGAAIMQFDAYARTNGASPDYEEASLLIRTVLASASTAAEVAVAGEGTIAGFGNITIPTRIEEEDPSVARYRVDLTVLIKA